MTARQQSAGGPGLAGRVLRLGSSVLLFLVLAELAALGLLRHRTGQWPDLGALEQELGELAGGATVDAGLGEVPTTTHEFLDREALHPYVGFLPPFTAEDAVEDGLAMNQDAFYAPDSPVFDPRGDAFVVGVVGGSVAGRFVRDGGGEALAALLADRPEVGGRPVRFAVMAFGGHKQPQGLMALNHLLSLGGRLDLLLALDGFNEVALHEHENRLHAVAPSYPRAWFYRVGMEELVKPVQAQLALLGRERRDQARELLDSPLRRSWIRRLVWRRADQDLARRQREADGGLRELVAEHDLLLRGPLSQATTSLERLDELVAVWRRSSLQLDALCRANDIEYLHFLQPNQYVEGSKPLSEQELDAALTPGHMYGVMVADGYPRLHEAGAELAQSGVRFHDLTGVYGEVQDTVYVDDCCHVNELGNRLLATAMAAEISRER
jgi:hypothetical protein